MPDCSFIACFTAAITALAPPLPMQMEKGIASVYSGGGHIACGGRFNGATLTAAHRTLPCGSLVRVWLRERHVDVLIVDRGPFVRGRIIDLTPAAAKVLGFDGLAQVAIEIIK